MSSPSAKDLLKDFPKIGSVKADELAKRLKDALDSEEEDALDDAMDFANEVIDGNGVEGVKGEGAHVDNYWRDTILLYVNMGDTYDTTVMYDTENEEFLIGSYGDFVEQWENEDDEDGKEDEESDEEEEEESDEEESDEDSDTSTLEENAEEAGE
jgi:hypothetical protein